MKYLLILNGPPRCGKDTAANYIHENIKVSSSLVKMSQPLKSGLAMIFNLNLAQIGQLEGDKETPSQQLYGMSWREAQIWLSESAMKKRFGVTIFGRIAAKKMSTIPEDLVIISDAGFEPELLPILNGYHLTEHKLTKVLLLKIRRPLCDFKNDSRSYLNEEALNIPAKVVGNFGTKEEYEVECLRIAEEWLGRD